jgi:hypothetical protein
MKVTSNIGKTGVDSIRIGGMKLDDLPMAEAAQAKAELPKFIEQERLQKIANIKAEYPPQTTAFLDSSIKACEENIVRVGQMRDRENALISEYVSIITMCQYRDKQIAKLTDEGEIKELLKEFPPYKIDALQQQIIQSTESIERADSVIAREYKDIAEFKELTGLCHQRDSKLKNLER